MALLRFGANHRVHGAAVTAFVRETSQTFAALAEDLVRAATTLTRTLNNPQSKIVYYKTSQVIVRDFIYCVNSRL